MEISHVFVVQQKQGVSVLCHIKTIYVPMDFWQRNLQN